MDVATRQSSIARISEALDLGQELFLEPARVVEPGSWVGHIPFAIWLIKNTRPDVFVELGTHSGNSYAAFCQAISTFGFPTRAFAVDTWRGDEHAGFYDETVLSDLSAFNSTQFGCFSQLLRATFDDARAYFAPKTIDLLHLDGLHTYEAVRHDFENWFGALSNRAIVVLHDINVRERNFGVWRLWEELSSQYPSFAFHHSHGLGVLGVGTELSFPLQSLFELEAMSEAAHAVRNIFASRGEAFRVRLQVAEADRRLVTMACNEANSAASAAQLTAEVLQLRNERAEQATELAQLRAERAEQATELAQLREASLDQATRAKALESALAEARVEAATVCSQRDLARRAARRVAAAAEGAWHAQVGELKGQVAELDQQAVELKGQVAELDQQAVELKGQVEEWRRRYLGLRGRLEAILRRFCILRVSRLFPVSMRRFMRERMLGPVRQ